MEKRLTGIMGEQLACKYYLQNKFEISAVNYKTRLGEIDIIAKKKNLVVFIEVKTRSETSYVSPKEAVTYSKQQKIKSTALIYIDKNNLGDCEVRFDVAEVFLNKSQTKLNIIENAFQ